MTDMDVNNTVYRDHLKPAATFMRENFRRRVRVAEIAAVVKLSACHFIRVFRQAFGETPLSMRDRLRVELAAELLTATNKTLASVAADCGFRDHRNLITTFRRVKGTTPGKFRKENRCLVN